MIPSKRFMLSVAFLSLTYTVCAQSTPLADQSQKIENAVKESIEQAKLPGMVAAIS